MSDLLCVGGRRAGLVVDDLALLHEIEDADQFRQTVLMQVRFDRNFHGIGLHFGGQMMLPQVGVAQTPAELCGQESAPLDQTLFHHRRQTDIYTADSMGAKW